MNPNDFESFCWESISPTQISLPEGLSPRNYLQFAIDDLGMGSERELINSASNSKKALHLQVKLISDALGFKAPRKEKDNFPPRLELCKACGVVGSRVLKKLNRLRNAIEHDYIAPTKEQAEDFIDVVELFLAATNGLIIAFPRELSLATDDLPPELPLITNYLECKWEPSSGEIGLEATLLTIPLDELHQQAKVEEEFILQNKNEKRDKLKQDAYRSVISKNQKEVKRTVSVSEKDDYCAWAAFIIGSSGRVF